MPVGVNEAVGFVVQQLIVFAFQPSRFSRSTFHVSHPHVQGPLCQAQTSQERLVNRRHPFRHIVFFTYTSQQTAITRLCQEESKTESVLSEILFILPPHPFLFFASSPLSNAVCLREGDGFVCLRCEFATASNAKRPPV